MASRKRRRKAQKRVPRPKDGLNVRQRLFIAEYLVSYNATDAARKAGYSGRTAYSQGQRLLKHVEIAAAIAKAEQERFQRLQMTGDEVLAELAHLARSDITEYVQWGEDGAPLFKPSRELTPAQAAAVRSIKFTTRTTRRGHNGDAEEDTEVTVDLKLHDKPGSLKMIGQRHKLFAESVEHSGPGGGPIPIDVRQDLDDRLDAFAGRIAAAIPPGVGSAVSDVPEKPA